MHELRVSASWVTIAVAIALPGLADAAHAGPAPGSLRLSKTDVDVRLSWLGGNGPYGVYRSSDASEVSGVDAYVALRDGLTHDEPLEGLPALAFYLVDDPPSCGAVGPCTGPPLVLADVQLSAEATARRAVDDGELAYVASGTAGLTVLDIASPDAPVAIGAWSEPALGDCNDVVKIGDIVYLPCGEAGVRVLDVAVPQGPTLVSTVPAGPDGAASVDVRGDALYVGVGGTVEVWNVADPSQPQPLTVVDPGVPAAVVRVRVDGDRLYCLYADGTLTVTDVSGDPALPTPLATVATSPQPTDLAVEDGIAYCSYDGAGVRIVDLREPTLPEPLWSDGGSSAIGVAVRGRRMVCTYGDGRVLTFGLRDLTAPSVLAAAIVSQPASGVSVFGGGVAWCGYGSNASVLDVPPFVLGASPRPGTTGTCGDDDVRLFFSDEIDPSTVDAGSVIVSDAGGSAVPGARVVAADEVVFTPDAALAPGDHDVVVASTVANLRGTAGPSSGFGAAFAIDPSCIRWAPPPPVVVAGGSSVDLDFEVLGGPIVDPEVLVAPFIDPADAFLPSTEILPVSGAQGSYRAVWVAPTVSSVRTFHAVARGELGGVVGYSAVVTVRVEP